METHDVANVITESIVKARPSLRSNSGEEILKMKFSDLSLDSLDLTTLSLDVEDACGVVVEPDDFDRCQTLGDLQDFILRSM